MTATLHPFESIRFGQTSMTCDLKDLLAIVKRLDPAALHVVFRDTNVQLTVRLAAERRLRQLDLQRRKRAIRYSAGALKAARAQAQALAAPDADAIAAMRARNAARLADFVPAAAVTPARAAAPRSTPVAAALASIPIQRRAAQASAANDAALAASLDAV